MNKNNSIFIAIIGGLAIIIIALIIYVNKNVSGTPATVKAPVDMHGRPLSTNISAAPLQDLVDKPAPDFTLADRNGKQYSLNELRGKDIVLFFNEGLMCYPACWNQIASLGKDERFKNSDTVVLSVVVDSPEQWQKAINKMPELAKATVVFDKNAVVSKAFGMLTATSSMHYGSLPGHSFILIDKEGVVRHVFDDPNMSIHNDQLVIELGKLAPVK